MRDRLPRVRFIAIALVVIAGCGEPATPAASKALSLDNADVKSMSVDIRRPEKTICPRQRVQMAVLAEVLLSGAPAPRPLETWAGPGEGNKKDKLDFTEFAFTSDQGKIDKNGWFDPEPNMLVTANHEFEIKTVYKRQPDRFSFVSKYKPDYSCIKDAGVAGAAGKPGQPGPLGIKGQEGSHGAPTMSGAAGADGTPGGPGTAGGDGAPGLHLIVRATIVKTAFYDRLIAVAVDGDKKDLLFFPEGQTLVIHAVGGAGGPGGRGGEGGGGGTGGAGNPGGNGGKGGPGGQGGPGGIGGAGGTIEYVYDTNHPELANAVHADISGGGEGEPGLGGEGGKSGFGGGGLSYGNQEQGQLRATSQDRGPGNTTTIKGNTGVEHNRGKIGNSGPPGPNGPNGPAGRPGPDGHASLTAGDVKEAFAGFTDLQPL